MSTMSMPHSGPREDVWRKQVSGECPRELAHDVANYVTEYARTNPGYTALWCLGIGFVLGWKLKPW